MNKRVYIKGILEKQGFVLVQPFTSCTNFKMEQGCCHRKHKLPFQEFSAR